jgi:hypothetical protein
MGLGKTLEEVIIRFGGSMAGGALVVIAGLSSMKLVTCRKVVNAKLSYEVAAFAHFRIDSSEDVPVDSMKSMIVPVKAVFVVVNECRETGLGAYSSLETTGDGDAVNRKHDFAFRVEGYSRKGGRVFLEFHGGKSVGLNIHLSFKRKVRVGEVTILVAEDVLELEKVGEGIH